MKIYINVLPGSDPSPPPPINLGCAADDEYCSKYNAGRCELPAYGGGDGCHWHQAMQACMCPGECDEAGCSGYNGKGGQCRKHGGPLCVWNRRWKTCSCLK